MNIALNDIQPDPRQPRRHFDEATLNELASSISQFGVLMPILVRPYKNGFQIVHGERRWRAAHLAGLETIPSEVRELDDRTAFLLSFSENLQRDELNAIEEAASLQLLLDEFGYSQAEAGKLVGKSQPWIAGRLALLKLPAAIQEQVITRVINPSTARELARVKDPGQQEQLAQKAAQGNLTVREIKFAGEPPLDRYTGNDQSFYAYLKWAQQRRLYLQTVMESMSSIKYRNELTAVDLRVEWHAGRLFNEFEERFGNLALKLALKHAGRLVMALAEILSKAQRQTDGDGMPVGICDPAIASDNQARKIFGAMGWLDENADPLCHPMSGEVCDMMLDWWYLLRWHHGDPSLWREFEKSKSQWEMAFDKQLTGAVPLDGDLTSVASESEMAWARLVIAKLERRGLRLGPTGLAAFPDDLTLDEWAEGLTAFGLVAKHEGDDEAQKKFRNLKVPYEKLVRQNSAQ